MGIESRLARIGAAAVLAGSVFCGLPSRGVYAQENPGTIGRAVANVGEGVHTPEGDYIMTSTAVFCGKGAERYTYLNSSQGYGISFLNREGVVDGEGKASVAVFAPRGLRPGTYYLEAKYVCWDKEGNGMEGQEKVDVALIKTAEDS